jgi:DNA end-binding protein Ku
MPQAVWTGSLTFGLVNIPVRLYNATSPKDVRFHQFEAGTGRRIRYRRVAAGAPPESTWETAGPSDPAGTPAAAAEEPSAPHRPKIEPDARRESSAEPVADEAPEVSYEDVVKGYEIEPERFVMLDPAEIRALAPERSRAIEIEDFVDLAEIDPVYFEKSYYVAPGLESGAEKPYWLLHRAMKEEQRVGIARFVMRTREYLAAIRPAAGALMLETLFHADEVRQPAEVGIREGPEPNERELDIARSLIRSLVSPWEPERYGDTYRERVMELVRSRSGDATPVAHEEDEPASPRVQDLMAALQASLDAVKKRTGSEPRKQAKRTSKRRTG